MISHRWPPQSVLVWILVAPLLFALPAACVAAQEPTAQEGAWRAAPGAPAPTPTLTLQECLQLAMQRQPRIAAERASLAAAQDGQRALEALRLAGLVVPEIHVRRRQAALGVTAAAAGVDQAERETTYAVTRAYFTVLYAREQEKLARKVVERLTATRKVAKQQLEGGAREVTDADVRRTTVYLQLARTKQIQAAQGAKRALAALKEAIGLGPDGCLNVPQAELPVPQVRPCLGDLLTAALARRAGLIQTSVFAEAACLEVEAQGTTIHKRLETFAAGSDIHSRQVPQTVQDTEYRPGAIPPEMPTMLAGSRPERVKHAQSLHGRAAAVVEVTRNLITLEVEDAFLRWEEAAGQAAEAKEAAETGDKLAQDLNKDFTSRAKVRVEEVVNAHVLGSQARAQYTEFVYRQILALADLERVTAGGFCAGLVEAAPAAPAAGKE